VLKRSRVEAERQRPRLRGAQARLPCRAVIGQEGEKHRGIHSGNFALALRRRPLLVLALLFAPIAQLDRAPDYESGGCRFDSCWVRQFSFRIEKKTARRSLGEGGPNTGVYTKVWAFSASTPQPTKKPAIRRALGGGGKIPRGAAVTRPSATRRRSIRCSVDVGASPYAQWNGGGACGPFCPRENRRPCSNRRPIRGR
jgi:hypothetical protein